MWCSSYKKPNLSTHCLPHNINHTTISWPSEENIQVIFLTILFAYIAAILYFIPLRLHLDERAAAAAQRSARQRSGDPNLNGMRDQ
jgi:hypothetical protein